MRKGKIKILTESEKLSDVVKNLKLYEGVTDIEVDGSVLTYFIDEWASDYDIMVAVMNALSDASIDSEPYFDDGDDIVTAPISVEDSENDDDDENECDDDESHEHCHEHCHDDGCECCGHTHEYYKEGFFKAKKGKIIELAIALVVFIAGVIIGGIESVAVASPYVLIVAYALAGYEVLSDAFVGFTKKKFFNEQFLMILASIAAIALGETAEAVGIMLLFNVGELFEDGAVNNSLKAIENLKESVPEKVTVLNADGVEVKVKPEKVEVGSIVVCKAGDRIALDGVIIEGKSNLDTKTITGESVYRVGEEGSEVSGGFLVVDGLVKIKTTKTYADSAISKIVSIVESVNENKSKPEKFISVFAKYYTPIVVVVAILLAFIPPFFYETYSLGLNIWLKRAVMMLCVSCPCALVISVPLTYFCGVGKAASNGVLVKTTESLSALANCTTFAFDKTGTLTTGEFEVTKIISSKKFQGKVLEFCAILENNSNHPIAKSIVKKYGKPITQTVENYVETAGRGVSCQLNGQKLLCGNDKFLSENNVTVKEIDELGVKIYLAVDGEFAGVIVLNDTVRDTAYGAMMELYDEGVKNTVMLTGDNKEYARAVRKQLNMRQSVSELLPDGKVKEVERLTLENEKTGVAFVGDGINDAPVLASAKVGIAMGGLGSDLAVESADIVITDDDLSKIPFILKLAKRTNTISKQNIIVSIAIKVLIMILGVAGLTSSIWLAIGADVGVLILAILNSIRNNSKII